MRKIIIIGTLHVGLTPKNELQELLDRFKPDQLLVELSNDDIINDKIGLYSDEMLFAYDWAKDNDVLVNGFDANISVLSAAKNEEDNNEVIEEQKKIIEKYSWKDFNKTSYLKLLNTEKEARLIDRKKWDLREEKMLENILENIIPEGMVLIVTGSGHIPFFEKNIKDAIFPLK